ncbi:MAG: DNA-directed RNA polymerase subunit H [Candidatus Aenigmarchaeota archaeon]|nr:DNA-directed RNA polymerase subunit H [Candidatus Aenigmarchaeota archaeon]
MLLGIRRLEGDCIVDITKHELVPKHEILKDAEKKAVLEKYGVTESQLPKIRSSDPVIEMIGAVPGQVIKITRKSQTAGEADYFRLVVK